MFKRNRRVISLILSLLIILTGTVAFAEEGEQQTEILQPDVQQEQIVVTKEEQPIPETQEEDISEPIETVTPDGYAGLPDDFVITDEMLAQKTEILENGVLSDLQIAEEGDNYVAEEVIAFADSEEQAQIFAAAFNGVLKSFGAGLALIELPYGRTVVQAVTQSANAKTKLPAVFPNYVYSLKLPKEEIKEPGDKSGFTAQAAPTKQTWQTANVDDPYLKQPDSGRSNYQWQHDNVGAYAAWGTTMGLYVKVAVLDTGVQYTHPDLLGGVLTGEKFIESDTNDGNGHGTHVAGIIAARANSLGGRGIAPSADIVPVKVLNKDGGGSSYTISQGINWVTNPGGTRKADVINMSISDTWWDVPFSYYTTAAIKRGIVVVAAAGNEGSNTKLYPAAYPGVIAVAATDMNNLRSHFSNWGSWITIAAPGSYILSTVPTPIKASGYDVYGGTSMATPMVSGAVALYMSVFGKAYSAKDVAAIKNALVKAATTVGTYTTSVESFSDFEKSLTQTQDDVDDTKDNGDKGAPVAKPKPSTPSVSYPIGKVLNLSNIFNSANTVPIFTVNSSGMTFQYPKGIFPNTATVTISGTNFIVYTTNGTTPSIKYGEVTNGNSVTASSATINLNTLPVGKVVMKAICVNGQGVASKVATLSIKTINMAWSAISSAYGGMSYISGPEMLAPGKSGKYSAVVTAAAKLANKAITWQVDDTTKASVNAANGTVTIKSGAYGHIHLVAKAKANPDYTFAEYGVTITDAPISSISLACTAELPLNVGGSTQIAQITKLSNGGELAYLTGYVNWTTSNPKIATVDSTGVVTATGGGNVTITAKATDGSGKSAKITIKCFQQVYSVSLVSPPSAIVKGKSVTLKAATNPAKPSVAGVIWSLSEADSTAGATIDHNGKLTIPGDFSNSSVDVTVTAKDNPLISSTKTITVNANAATSVVISTSEDWGRVVLNSKTGHISSINLFTLNPPTISDFDNKKDPGSATAASVDERVIQLTASADGSPVLWKSSHTNVATVSSGGLISAVGVGKTTITATADDGSGKKATCVISVGNPASSLWVQGKAAMSRYSNPSLSFGSSLQLSAIAHSAYGKVTNAKVEWSVMLFYADGGVSTRRADLENNISISGTGKLSVKSELINTWAYLDGEFYVVAIADALDGSGVWGYQFVDLCPASIISLEFNRPVTAYGVDNGDYLTVDFVGMQYFGDYIITSSNPNVMSIEAFVRGQILIRKLKNGTTTLKAVAADGSGKSTSVKITFK